MTMLEDIGGKGCKAHPEPTGLGQRAGMDARQCPLSGNGQA